METPQQQPLNPNRPDRGQIQRARPLVFPFLQVLLPFVAIVVHVCLIIVGESMFVSWVGGQHVLKTLFAVFLLVLSVTF